MRLIKSVDFISKAKIDRAEDADNNANDTSYVFAGKVDGYIQMIVESKIVEVLIETRANGA